MIELYRKRETGKIFYLRGFIELVKVGLIFGLYYYFQDYRCLFYAFIISSVIQLSLSYIIAPIKTKFEIKVPLLRDLFDFSKWLQLKNLTKVVANNVDSIILGSFLGPSSLGLYNRSRVISHVPEQVVGNINDVYLYPLISQNKNNPEALKKCFEGSMLILIWVLTNLILGFFIFGLEIIRLFLGDSWSGMHEPLGVLILSQLGSCILNSLFPFL
ncbi:oligosaccharide flippase family protein, partial [Akkermansiaceae bacterium]|nr:oligosaccharide flippase family protein [Akkermansiaceae bacterium]